MAILTNDFLDNPDYWWKHDRQGCIWVVKKAINTIKNPYHFRGIKPYPKTAIETDRHFLMNARKVILNFQRLNNERS